MQEKAKILFGPNIKEIDHCSIDELIVWNDERKEYFSHGIGSQSYINTFVLQVIDKGSEYIVDVVHLNCFSYYDGLIEAYDDLGRKIAELLYYPDCETGNGCYWLYDSMGESISGTIPSHNVADGNVGQLIIEAIPLEYLPARRYILVKTNAGSVYLSQSIMLTPETRENTSVPAEVSHVDLPIYYATQPDMFPAEWLADPINITAADLPVVEYTRSGKIIRKAMQAYPSHILADNLATIYVVGSLSFSGITAGGTYWTNVIYLANEGLGLGYTDRFIEAAFHHEFSSILLQNYPWNFDVGAWHAANPPDFFYSSNGVDAVYTGQASKVLDEALNCAGFLNQYATSSLEEDFNEISENLFMNEIAFWNAVDLYPALRAKVDVAISFYNALDEMFTEQYFRSR